MSERTKGRRRTARSLAAIAAATLIGALGASTVGAGEEDGPAVSRLRAVTGAELDRVIADEVATPPARDTMVAIDSYDGLPLSAQLDRVLARGEQATSYPYGRNGVTSFAVSVGLLGSGGRPAGLSWKDWRVLGMSSDVLTDYLRGRESVRLTAPAAAPTRTSPAGSHRRSSGD